MSEVRLPFEEGELSARYAEPVGPPLALVVALPGGGMTSGYFDGRLHRSLSLLPLASSLGYSVLSFDRPGYGSSEGISDRRTTIEGQAQTVWSALKFWERTDPDVPILLLGHSFGAMVALQMAAHNPTELQVWGVDFSGIGTTYAEAVFSSLTKSELWEMHWGSADNYPEGAFDRANLPTSRLPGVEGEAARTWPGKVSDIVAAVRCAVRITIAEGELNWINEPREFAAMFTNAESVGVDIQPRSGHNISLSWAARAYHLRVLAFFDDCVRLRRLAKS